MCNKPKTLKEKERTALINEDGELTKVFSSVVDDIFRKFDLFIGRELSYPEFKILYQMTGNQELLEEEFKSNFLKKYCSTSEGITLRGLKHYFKDSIKTLGDDIVRTWLLNLGYDEHLFNSDSRAFTLTFHCDQKF